MPNFHSVKNMPFLTANPTHWLDTHKEKKLIIAILKGKKPIKAYAKGLFEKPYNYEEPIQSFLSSLEILSKLPPDSPSDFSPHLEALSLVSHLIEERPTVLSPSIYFRLRDIKNDLFYNVKLNLALPG